MVWATFVRKVAFFCAKCCKFGTSLLFLCQTKPHKKMKLVHNVRVAGHRVGAIRLTQAEILAACEAAQVEYAGQADVVAICYDTQADHLCVGEGMTNELAQPEEWPHHHRSWEVPLFLFCPVSAEDVEDHSWVGGLHRPACNRKRLLDELYDTAAHTAFVEASNSRHIAIVKKL